MDDHIHGVSVPQLSREEMIELVKVGGLRDMEVAPAWWLTYVDGNTVSVWKREPRGWILDKTTDH